MPRTFTDTAGREWKIVIGLYTANRIRELSDGIIDFVQTSRVQSARNALIEMSEDVGLCGRVLWWLCEDQAKERNISEIQFSDAFDLDVLEAAQTAVAEAIIDFFPSRSRPALRKAAAIAQETYDADMKTLDQQTGELIQSPEFETMIRNAVTHGTRSGSSQDLRAVDPVIYSVSHPSSPSDNCT